jgi:hypothetical protein
MKKKENIFIRILLYALDHPCWFLGFCSWGGAIPLAFFDGLLGWNIPHWFNVFLFLLGVVFLGLGQKYETGEYEKKKKGPGIF